MPKTFFAALETPAMFSSAPFGLTAGPTSPSAVLYWKRIWSLALDEFDSSAVLPQYLGQDYCRLFGTVRRGECEQFTAQVSNVDYEWYLRVM